MNNNNGIYSLKRKSPTDLIQISSKRGRPLLLDGNLDTVLRTFITNLRLAGGTVDRHSVHGVLMGIIKSNLTRYGGYLDFKITNGWIQSLYARMNLSRRMVTTSRPIVTRALWNEVRYQFLNEIVTAVALYNIPDELIINVDQTPSKFVSTGNFTMAVTNSKQVAKKGSNDKRGMTITLAETLSGKMLPFQLIYHGKTSRSLPSVPFPDGFLLSYNEKHWSNEQETKSLLMKVLKPYVDRTKEELGLGIDQKFLLIWDAFKAQGTDGTCKTLEELNAIPVMTPKNLTHLLQPLDLSTNRSFKNFEKKAFSNYFTETITAAMLQEPDRDITTIDVDFKLSTLKPKHGRLMGELFNFFNSEKGMEIIKAGWSYSGIASAITNSRKGDIDFRDLDPYKDILSV